MLSRLPISSTPSRRPPPFPPRPSAPFILRSLRLRPRPEDLSAHISCSCILEGTALWPGGGTSPTLDARNPENRRAGSTGGPGLRRPGQGRAGPRLRCVPKRGPRGRGGEGDPLRLLRTGKGVHTQEREAIVLAFYYSTLSPKAWLKVKGRAGCGRSRL